jgi:hypothetical protein
MNVIDMIQSLNNNKVITALAMFTINVGSRYVYADISKLQDEVMKSKLAKIVILFCIFFVATRDLVISGMLTIAFEFILFGLLNEDKIFSIFEHDELDTVREKYDTFVSYQ